RLCREAAEALHEAGTQGAVCGNGRRREIALWSLPEFWRSGCRDAEHGICRLQLGEMHIARSAEGVAQVPAQGQEQEEIRQGQIHSDSCKASLENQRKNETAQGSAA